MSIAERGIKTASDFAELMAALIYDVLQQNVTPNISNAASNAGGKLLKVVELQFRYGQAEKPGDKKVLVLTEKDTD